MLLFGRTEKKRNKLNAEQIQPHFTPTDVVPQVKPSGLHRLKKRAGISSIHKMWECLLMKLIGPTMVDKTFVSLENKL